MDIHDKLNMIMNMRYHINYCALFNDHHDEEVDIYPSKIWHCSDCARWFPAKQSYKRHRISSLHARNVELLNDSEDDDIDDKDGLHYPCHVCRKVYTSPVFLARHEATDKHKAKVLKKSN